MLLNTIFDAMEAGNWEKAKEEIKREANYLTLELENKIGVLNSFSNIQTFTARLCDRNYTLWNNYI